MFSDQLDDLFRNRHVSVAYLFGSRAQGTHRCDSDYDIAVLFDHDATLGEAAALQVALSAALGSQVDVVELQHASLELRAAAVQDGRLLFSDDESGRVRFETTTRALWFDYEPVMRDMTRSYLARVARGA